MVSFRISIFNANSFVFEAVLGTEQNWGGRWNDSHMPLALKHALPAPYQQLPPVIHLLQMTRRNHPKSTVYIRFTLGVVRSMDLDKCVMACVHMVWYDSGIIWNILAALKILCSHVPISPLIPLATNVFSPSSFCLFQGVIQLESYNIKSFQTGFFHWEICIEASSMFFHGLIVHCF